jgi:glycosyltransferase involved in cell wall biosynthesis
MPVNKNIIIHSNYRPDNHGGVEAVVSQLIGVLGSLGYRVKCFCGHTGSSGKMFHKGHEVVFRRILAKIAGAPLLNLGNIYFLRNARKADLIIYQEPFPLLWPAIFILRQFYNIPTIVLVHADPIAPNSIRKAYSKLRTLVFRGAVCIATSPNLMSKVTSPFYPRTAVIPLGIPSESPISGHVLQLPQRYVLYFGRLSGYKGIPYLLDSIRNLPDVNFVIAGKGPLASEVRHCVFDGKIKNLTFLDRFISEEEKSELISRCEFFVFPSINENEAFGIVQLEAMRSAKAIVNTWIDSGVNYVAPHEVCALTVKPLDSAELTKAIQRLWLDPELCHHLGNKGKERYFSLFTEEAFNTCWSGLIKGILNNE